MGDRPTDDSAREDETAKLELPSLRLPRLGRRRTKATRPAEDPPASQREQPGVDQPTAQGSEPHRAVEPEHVEHRTLPATTIQRPVDAAPIEGVSRPRRAERRRRGAPALPTVPGWVTAAVTGIVVGVVGAALTWASLRGCEAVKGTESCGGTGLPLLVVILALMVLLGGLLLAAWGTSEPRSTSFLAVGVLCVVLLVTLIQQLFSGWMFLAVPLLTAGSYALAHYVTTTFVEPTPERGPEHDVR